jgi:hypothetical protein
MIKLLSSQFYYRILHPVARNIKLVAEKKVLLFIVLSFSFTLSLHF